MKQIIIGLVLKLAFVCAIIFALFKVFLFALDQNEIQGCNSLLAQSKEGYDRFFITKVDFDVCRERGIIIDAKIK